MHACGPRCIQIAGVRTGPRYFASLLLAAGLLRA